MIRCSFLQITLAICLATLLAACASTSNTVQSTTPSQVAWAVFLHQHTILGKQGIYPVQFRGIVARPQSADKDSTYLDLNAHPLIEVSGNSEPVNIKTLSDEDADKIIQRSGDQELISLHQRMKVVEATLKNSKEMAELGTATDQVQLINRSYGVDPVTNGVAENQAGAAMVARGEVPNEKSSEEIIRADREMARSKLARQRDLYALKADSKQNKTLRKGKALEARVALPASQFFALARKYTPSGSKGWLCTIDDRVTPGTFYLAYASYGTWVY